MSLEDLDLTNPEVISALKDKGFITSADVSYEGYIKAEDVDSKVAEAKSALEATNKALKQEKQAEKEKLAELKAQLEGIDLEKARERQQRAAEDDLMKMLEANNTDGLKAHFNAPLLAQIEQLQNAVSESERQAQIKEQDLQEKLNQISLQKKQTDIKRLIGAEMSNMQDQIQPTAFSDIEEQAQACFDFDESGKLVIKDSNGVVQTTAEGALDAKGWLVKLREDKPYLFKGGQGGGNPPSTKAPNTDVNGKQLFGMARLAEKRKRQAAQQG